MLKNVLLLLVLSSFLIGCDSLPPSPEVNLCGYDSKGGTGFYCVNTKTNESSERAPNAPIMHGAQCLSLDDYKSLEAYYEDLRQLARKNCR